LSYKQLMNSKFLIKEIYSVQNYTLLKLVFLVKKTPATAINGPKNKGYQPHLNLICRVKKSI